MAKFTNKNTVVVGLNNLGSSPYGAISIASIGAVGTVGIYDGADFYPHPDGALPSGGMLTFEIGRGRVIGFEATTAGTISILEV